MQTYSDSPRIFVSGRTLALWTTILLAANALLGLIHIGFEALQLFLISAQPETAAAALSDDDIDFSEMPGGGLQLAVLLHGGVAAIFYLIAFIVTIILFLIWQHRAYSNLRTLGVPRPEYSSGWVIGSWFVPFLNLVRPFEITKYIWRKSDPETVDSGDGFGAYDYSGGANLTMNAWWGFWIAGNIAGRISDRISLRASNLSDYVVAGWVTIFASFLAIFAAFLAIGVVRSINARQEERYKRLMAASQEQSWSQNYSAGVAPHNFT